MRPRFAPAANDLRTRLLDTRNLTQTCLWMDSLLSLACLRIKTCLLVSLSNVHFRSDFLNLFFYPFCRSEDVFSQRNMHFCSAAQRDARRHPRFRGHPTRGGGGGAAPRLHRGTPPAARSGPGLLTQLIIDSDFLTSFFTRLSKYSLENLKGSCSEKGLRKEGDMKTNMSEIEE